VYGLSSLPNARNAADPRNHSRYYRQRLRAEVLADALGDITGVRENFSAMPANSRAKEIWTHRVESLLLDTFGRPDPNQDPPCERLEDATVTQALHLMNGSEIQAKVTANDGLAARLAESARSSEQIVEELYLSVYTRYPDDQERMAAAALLDGAAGGRRPVTEDLLWALLNTPEFLMKD
jgi:hypothetical protein